jgi:hypothetical protein
MGRMRTDDGRTFVIGVNATAYFPIYLKSRPEYTIQQVNT